MKKIILIIATLLLAGASMQAQVMKVEKLLQKELQKKFLL